MKRIVLIIAMLLSAGALRANGDPVAERSALTLARMPVAVHVPEVKLLDEQCRFTLRDGYTEVEVRYLLHNQSAKDFHQLPYGFPVDWLGSGAAHWDGRDFYSESIVERGWRDSYVRDVMFSLNGQSLPWQCSADTLLRRAAALYDYEIIKEIMWDRDSTLPESDPLFQPDSTGDFYTLARERQIIAKYGDSVLWYGDAVNRRWYYVRLDIPAGQVVELTVRYVIETNMDRSLSEGQSVFRASEHLCCAFRYDFSPAAYWGDGLAQRFRVEVDKSDIVLTSFYDMDVKGLPMREVGGRLLYEARDFNLAAALPLEIGYCTERIHEDVADLLGRRISPDQYTITVSGADRRYPIGNLGDMDLSTATVLLPDDVGQIYITITFHDSVMLTGVLLYNGYCKDRQTWLNNSRIATVACKDLDEWLFDFGGVPETFTWQGLTDAAVKLPAAGRYMGGAWGGHDYRQKTKQITLRITSVTPGIRYADLCVSEILLLGD